MLSKCLLCLNYYLLTIHNVAVECQLQNIILGLQITCYGCLFDFHGYMYSVVVVMLSKDITTLYMYPINLFNSCPNSFMI